MRKLVFFIGIILILGLSLTANLMAQDGIPDNCEHSNGEFYNQNLFPRYEPQNQRLVLVDWATGADVQVVAENLTDTRIQGWSLDCRYLVGAVGPAESMDTTVWDVVNNVQIGVVADAYLQPHIITWGPGNYLVVETRNGAILWHVPANTQIMLTTNYDSFSARNFTRLRWNASNGQLIANLAGGGRVVYDLATGAEAPYVAEQTDSIPSSANPLGTIIIGGAEYPCQVGYRYGYRNWYRDTGNQVPGVYPEYSLSDRTIYLALRDIYDRDEILAVLETDVDASWYDFRGWSANCRYFAASLGVVGQDASDTVVWDVIENRRVGTFADARQIMHPLFWDTTGNALLIETRDGAYLWHLPTDTRTLLTETVETSLDGNSGIQSFYDVQWDANRSELLTVEIGNETAVTVFNGISGERIGTYPITNGTGIVDFVISDDSSHLIVYNDTEMTVWNRDTNTSVDLNTGDYGNFSDISTLQISPNHRYIVNRLRYPSRLLVVWDIQDDNSLPSYVHENGSPFWSYEFLDDQTIISTSNRSYRLNIITGEFLIAEGGIAPTSGNPIDGVSGYSQSQSIRWWRDNSCNGLSPAYDETTRTLTLLDESETVTRIVETNLNSTERMRWSPDCRYLEGEVSQVTNEEVGYDNAPVDDVYRDLRSETIVIWDVQTGERIYEFNNPYYYGAYTAINWSPAGDRLLIRTSEGHFVLNLQTRQAVLLTYTTAGNFGATISVGFQSYWDYQRGQVLVSARGGVIAFDLNTGVERFYFRLVVEPQPANQTRCPRYINYGCDLTVIDNNYLLVQGFETTAVWHLDNFTYSAVDTDPGASYRGGVYRLSPDGRYLVVALSRIRVWDLYNLPEDLIDRDPVYNWQGPSGRVQEARFVDNITIETTSADGVQLWNVETGELLSTTESSD